MNFEVPQQLLQKYIHHRVDEIPDFRKFLMDRNYEKIIEKAQNIKGTALSFGFEELDSFSKKMEFFALDKKPQEIADLIATMENWLNRKTIDLTHPLPI